MNSQMHVPIFIAPWKRRGEAIELQAAVGGGGERRWSELRNQDERSEVAAHKIEKIY